MRLLELFSGSGSVGKAFTKIGWEVISVDIDPRSGATHNVDIHLWDFTVYDRSHFDFIWMSPVCQHYSCARTTGGPRDLAAADRLVQRALDIRRHFGTHYALENPTSGLLKTRDIINDLPYFNTSYCRYGYPYRKNTTIWSSLELNLRPPCSHKDPCSSMIGRRHPKTAQQGRRSCDASDTLNRCPQSELYSIPPALCDEIAQAAQAAHAANAQL